MHKNSQSPWRNAGLILLLACSVVLGACAHTPPKPTLPAAPAYDPIALQAKSLELARQVMAQKPPTTNGDYDIGPADVLEISVFEVIKYATTARVSGDGTIRFPDLGIVKVGGLSERKAEDLLQKMLKEKELVMNPQVTVFVKELHAKEVTVAGEVKTPGVYPIRGGESLIDVISKAGGLSTTAGSYAYILRSGNKQAPQPIPALKTVALNDPPTAALAAPLAAQESPNIKVDLVGLLMRGETQWNFPLQAGDRVTIPTVGWVHVTGLGVEKAGTYQLRSTPNLLRQSIDDAGGLIFAADKNNLVIIRRNPDGRQETFTVDYAKILADEKYDITLQGGDTIIVNRTPFKTFLAAVGAGAKEVFRFSIGGYLPIFGNTYGGGY